MGCRKHRKRKCWLDNIVRSCDVDVVKPRDAEDVKVKKCVRKGAGNRGDDS